ncbi:hypothetical protein [Lysobacter antibioticus]|uniref:Uncharacterized protein n=1 Tax=Lysobacter antibioticus TaxID=84531 RepID=A0A0S2F7P2_LYSAN|nr:hypothetical protein [Lysobacter antibioticus]ALN79558.1 hypothetical protein LA76x_1402 [Lysobacter antibioticus]
MRAPEFGEMRFERALAWTVVALVHAGLIWAALQLRRPADPVDSEASLTVIFLRPAVSSSSRPNEALRTPPARDLPRKTTPRSLRPVFIPEPAAPLPMTPPHAAPTASAEAVEATGLTAIRIDRNALDPAGATRAPWDAPAPDLLASRAPVLPGQGARRFRMQPPNSIARTVERVGRLFGGRGEDPCLRTRDNIGELAVQGDSAALQRELEYERRLCRP